MEPQHLPANRFDLIFIIYSLDTKHAVELARHFLASIFMKKAHEMEVFSIV